MNEIINLLESLNIVGKVTVGIIIFVFIFSTIMNFIIRKQYRKINENLENNRQKKAGIFKNELLNKIVQEYKSAAKDSYSEVNTPATIEKCFNDNMKGSLIGEKFINKSVSILIILGLLGTFLGLTLSVSELVNVLAKNANSFSSLDVWNDILGSMASAAKGMGVAFVTSLVGIAFSIILNVLLIVASCTDSRETLFLGLEEYLDNTVSVVVSKDKETEYTMLNKILRETFVEFGEKIENSLKDTVATFGDKLSHVAMDVSISSQALDQTVEKFENSLNNFAANIKDLSGFNTNLSSNIELMDSHFSKVTVSLTNASAIISKSFDAIEVFSVDVTNAAEKINNSNTEVLQTVKDLLIDVNETVSSVKTFGELIKETSESSSSSIIELQEKFVQSVHALGEEINTLGHSTAKMFTESFTENTKSLSIELVSSVKDVLREVMGMLDSFNENERALAKTIAMIPQQSLAYNESTSLKINKGLNDIKQLIDNK